MEVLIAQLTDFIRVEVYCRLREKVSSARHRNNNETLKEVMHCLIDSLADRF